MKTDELRTRRTTLIAHPPVLYVEDDPNDVVLMRCAWTKVGVLNPLQVATDGAAALRYLSGVGPNANRVAHPMPSLVLTDMRGGAVDVLTKPVNDRTLLGAIERAVTRARQRWREYAKITEIQDRVKILTPRETEVFALVVTGMLNKQIASELGVSEKMVKVHRARVMISSKGSSRVPASSPTSSYSRALPPTMALPPPASTGGRAVTGNCFRGSSERRCR